MIKKIFSFIWRKHLHEQKLIKILGWRSALIDDKYGQRRRATFLINFPFLDK
jgi:hypothetical protein